MSNSRQNPLERLPNPRQVGPLDLAAAGWQRFGAWLHRWRHYLAGAVALVAVIQVVVFVDSGVWFLHPPRIPNWLLVVLLPAPILLVGSAVFGAVATAKVDSQNTVLLSVLTSDDGDQQLQHVSQDTWADMRVVNQSGRVKGRDYLQTVVVNGVRAYEVDDYWRDGNVAIASSMAGRRDYDMRKDRHEIARAKSELERENDRMWDALVSHGDHVRDHASTVANHLIRTVEGVRVPDGASLYDDLQASLDNGPDLVDELDLTEFDPNADDRADQDDQDDDDSGDQDVVDAVGTIFERAKAAENGAARADGGRET